VLKSGVKLSRVPQQEQATTATRAPNESIDRNVEPLSAVQAAMRQAEQAFNEAVAQASQRMQELPLQLRKLLEQKLVEIADACGFAVELSASQGVQQRVRTRA
jgi:hypothetical protein